MPASAYHDAASGSIERGNALGERSSVRQSRYFRQYESGNNVKSLLGTDNLCWDVERKEGVFQNHAVYDGRKLEYAPATFGAPPPSQQYFGAPPPSQQYYGAPPQSQQYDAPPPPQQTWQQYDPPPPPQHTLQQNDPPPPQQVRGGRATMSMSDDALWSAVGGRDMAEVQRLLRQGSNPNMICPDGWVKDECRPKDGSVGRSLLHHAAWAGDLGIFKLLVDSGAEVDRKRNTAWRPNGGVRGRGSTALHHACQYNRQAIVSYLIDELGCDINAPGEQGYTPLHLAAKFNYPRLVEYLLQRGARTDMLTRDEKTPRDLAAPRQERSSFQMGDMLELFDKYDRESRSRPKLLPGAPLPPDPRLHAHEGPTGHVPYHEAPPTSAAAAKPFWLTSNGAAQPHAHGGAAQHGATPPPPPPPPAIPYGANMQLLSQRPPPDAQRYDRDAAVVARRFGGGVASGFASSRSGLSRERGQQRQMLPPSQPLPPPHAQHAVQNAMPSDELRPDQTADALAAATRRRAAGSRPW